MLFASNDPDMNPHLYIYFSKVRRMCKWFISIAAIQVNTSRSVGGLGSNLWNPVMLAAFYSYDALDRHT